MNPLYPRMLCAKFGWNWPSGSGIEDENMKSLRQERQRRQRQRRRTTDKCYWGYSPTHIFPAWQERTVTRYEDPSPSSVAHEAVDDPLLSLTVLVLYYMFQIWILQNEKECCIKQTLCSLWQVIELGHPFDFSSVSLQQNKGCFDNDSGITFYFQCVE